MRIKFNRYVGTNKQYDSLDILYFESVRYFKPYFIIFRILIDLLSGKGNWETTEYVTGCQVSLIRCIYCYHFIKISTFIILICKQTK